MSTCSGEGRQSGFDQNGRRPFSGAGTAYSREKASTTEEDMKKILVLAGGLFLSTAFAAHSETVLLSMKGPGSGNPFWAAVQAGAEEKAKELGVTLVALAPPEESDVQSQINQVQDQLTKKIDAMAIAPTDPHALKPLADAAKKQAVGVGFAATQCR